MATHEAMEAFPDQTTETWKIRYDVLQHFAAYHAFDKDKEKPGTIQLINLDDTDRKHLKKLLETKEAEHQVKFAEYLTGAVKICKTPIVKADEYDVAVPDMAHDEMVKMYSVDTKDFTSRQKLLWHLRLYNLTENPKRRIYVIGFLGNDMKFAGGLLLNRDELDVGYATLTPDDQLLYNLTIATDICPTLAVSSAEPGNKKDEIAEAVKEFLNDPNTQEYKKLLQEERESKSQLRKHLKDSAFHILGLLVVKLFSKLMSSNGNSAGQAGNGGN